MDTFDDLVNYFLGGKTNNSCVYVLQNIDTSKHILELTPMFLLSHIY